LVWLERVLIVVVLDGRGELCREGEFGSVVLCCYKINSILLKNLNIYIVSVPKISCISEK